MITVFMIVKQIQQNINVFFFFFFYEMYPANTVCSIMTIVNLGTIFSSGGITQFVWQLVNMSVTIKTNICSLLVSRYSLMICSNLQLGKIVWFWV